MNHRNYNRRALAFFRVLECECKAFIDGACCANHSWEIIELLRTVRQDCLRPLRKIMSDGSKIAYEAYSIEQIISTTGFVRSYLARIRDIPPHMLVSGSEVCDLMDIHRDIDKVADIIDKNRREKIVNQPYEQPVVARMVDSYGDVVITCGNPGSIN